MRILVTGSKGFLGRNLVASLRENKHEVLEFDRQTSMEILDQMCQSCDLVFHLAGVNRSTKSSDFVEGNTDLSETLLTLLQKHHNNAAVVLSSSTQADLDNDYGTSKRAAEVLFENHTRVNGSKVYIFKLTNLFGKWSKPNYNSVIATWSHRISRDESIEISDPNIRLNLNYVDDVVSSFLSIAEGTITKQDSLYYQVFPIYTKTLKDIKELLYTFKESRRTLFVSNMEDGFERKLYSTYLSYLPENQFSYDLEMNEDHRGSFTEFLKTDERGQVSINVSKPGITKGEHWHHSKNEKFLVVSGKGIIKLRKIDSSDIIEYTVNSDRLQVVDIPPGYTHNITNIGNEDMVTVMWVNEPFDSDIPDTFFLKV